MRRSCEAFFGIFFMLGVSFIISEGVYASGVGGYDISSGENGGSYLLVDGEIIISGGEVKVSGESDVPLRVIGDSKIILSNATIISSQGAAISVDSGVKAELILDGNNKVEGEGSGAGINVGFNSTGSMATLIIDGEGSLSATGGTDGGAGIGGNGTKNVDAINGKIIIRGGEIVAIAQKNSSGIGGGWGSESILDSKYSVGSISVDGGAISATGNGGGAGIGGGKYIDAAIAVNDGVFKAVYGGQYAAGIGGGFCSNNVIIKINKGSFSDIKGYESSADEMMGGAAIGSGAKMCDIDTKVTMSIIGGSIENAVAGWGAAGIGNGAGNDIESNIVIGKDAGITRLYTDGEKMPLEEGVSVEGNLLQAVFSESVDMSAEKSFEVVNYDDESEAYEMKMPKGYRAFATTVEKEASYSVRGSKYYADKETVGKAEEKIKLNVASGAIMAYSGLHPVEEMPERKIANDENDSSNIMMWICVGVGVLMSAIMMYVICVVVFIKKRASYRDNL